MITNTGKNIIAKYLVGQAPAYASYIAFGCGATPLASDGTLGDYSTKTSLDFEMYRSQITSRGYVNEDGVNKIVLTAELPTSERYQITEVGVFSAGSNSAAGAYDSKIVYSFSDVENWEYHSQTGAEKMPPIYIPLDIDASNIIEGSYKINPTTKEYDPTQTSTTEVEAFQTNADNKIFTQAPRPSRYENCRFLNNIVMLRGDTSTLSLNSLGQLEPQTGSNHIHLTGTVVDFNKNSPIDELKIAFSLINKNGGTKLIPGTSPDNIKILLEFASSDVSNSGEWARLEVNIDNTSFTEGTASTEQNFASNRYFVVTKQLQELIKSTGFTWSAVDVAKIFVSVTEDGSPSSDYYVALDAVRLENKTTANPLYGLTGYSVIRNAGSLPITKSANTTNYIEFRFGMDVQ